MKNLLLSFIFVCVSWMGFAQSLTTEETEEGLWVNEDTQKVLFYQAKTKSKDGKYPRANYVHPLYNVDGFELTEDFPKDHLHHRGIFWSWHQVIIGEKHIGDAWECKDFIWDVSNVIVSGKSKKSIRIHAKTNWKSSLWIDSNGELKPFVEENTYMVVHAKKDNYRVIDFEISLLAIEEQVKIGGSDDNKGYGGFSVRMKMPKDIKFTSAEGEVEPNTNQIDAGSWMDISGTLSADDGNGGVIIIYHPDNPMYPENWILRKKGSMQNPVFPGRKPVEISTTNPTVLKYRLVVYTGEMEQQSIEKIQQSFD